MSTTHIATNTTKRLLSSLLIFCGVYFSPINQEAWKQLHLWRKVGRKRKSIFIIQPFCLLDESGKEAQLKAEKSVWDSQICRFIVLITDGTCCWIKTIRNCYKVIASKLQQYIYSFGWALIVNITKTEHIQMFECAELCAHNLSTEFKI